AIGGCLTVEGSDRCSERLRVVDDLIFGDLALRLIASVRGEHIAANPEDVLDPEVAQCHLRLEDCGRICSSGGCCGACRCSKREARQEQQWNRQQVERYVAQHDSLLSLTAQRCRSGRERA